MCKDSEVSACNILSDKNGPFGECLQLLGNLAGDYTIPCKIDACAYKNSGDLKKVLCLAFEGLAKKCEDVGRVVNWRPATNCRKYI